MLPVIHGAVFVNRCQIDGNSFTWSVVTRRSRHRVGSRYKNIKESF